MKITVKCSKKKGFFKSYFEILKLNLTHLFNCTNFLRTNQNLRKEVTD